MKKISIVGVEGCGKTVLASVLGDKYATPDKNNLSLKAKTPETFNFCTSIVAAMRKGEWPQATLPGEMACLKWQLLCHKRSALTTVLGDIVLLDFAGEVYRQAFGQKNDKDSLSVVQEDVAMLRSHVAHSDVLIVVVNLKDVVNVDRTDPRTLEMLWLTQDIIEFAKSHGVGDVAIVLSQADRYSSVIQSCGGVKNAFRKYMTHVDSAFPQTEVFSISAVDKVVLNGTFEVPAPDFNSKGIEELVKWMSKRVANKNKSISIVFVLILSGLLYYYTFKIIAITFFVFGLLGCHYRRLLSRLFYLLKNKDLLRSFWARIDEFVKKIKNIKG